MRRKISVILFWVIMVLSVVALSRLTWDDWRQTLRIGAVVVPVVLFTKWLEGRFPARKRWTANVMIGSAMLAFVSGSIVVWDWTLYRAGFETPGGAREAAVAGAVCLTCVSAFVWSLIRLVRRGDKIPT